MYYTSTNQNELIAYVEKVNIGEQYNGTTTTWANVIKHYNEDLWAVKAHSKYEEELSTLDILDGWYEPVETV